MNTPEEFWISYRNHICDQEGSLGDVNTEFEAKRAFFAGSEAVYKILSDLNHLHPNQVFRMMARYREMNRNAAMDTIPDDEQEENLE